MKLYYLAIDIGASSGRHILGSMENGKLCLEEVHRFPNETKYINGHLCWDIEGVFSEIIRGMKKCKEQGKIPVSMGIDTWAVDFVLLDKKDRILGDTVSYRDHRTDQIQNEVYRYCSEQELYERTGIQKQKFNSIYQLMAIKKEHPEHLKAAKDFLMIPDYFHYRLTGVKRTEYTNATTTQLINAKTGNWDDLIINRLDFSRSIFREISQPSSMLGTLTAAIQQEVGFSCKVILPATHDTASAVLAVPSEEDGIYLSSGTWSLMGVERKQSDCSSKSMCCNFTNEGGYAKTYRYLKNIMGLWMLQTVKKELKHEIGFEELCHWAQKENIHSIVDCNDNRFLAPESMTEEIIQFCNETGQAQPENLGEVAAVIYNSLADCYRKTCDEIECLTHKKYSCIHIVGGGSQDSYLNRLTAKYAKKKVYAGPKEATAIGNLLAQMIGTGALESVKAARECVQKSFTIQQY